MFGNCRLQFAPICGRHFFGLRLNALDEHPQAPPLTLGVEHISARFTRRKLPEFTHVLHHYFSVHAGKPDLKICDPGITGYRFAMDMMASSRHPLQPRRVGINPLRDS
jgi:hypothetical protein